MFQPWVQSCDMAKGGHGVGSHLTDLGYSFGRPALRPTKNYACEYQEVQVDESRVHVEWAIFAVVLSALAVFVGRRMRAAQGPGEEQVV